jgi:peptidyl-prolyl cis-trans isomerase SurA
MLKTTRSLAFALSALFAFSPAFAQMAAAPQTSQIDRIVAVVDEDVILKSELDRAIANIKSQYADHAEQLPPEDVLQKQVLERLIVVRLQLARANDSGLKVSDAEVDQGIGRIAQENKMTTEQMQQKLAASGMSYDDFRKSVREELTVQKMQQQIIQDRVAVSETEIDNELATQRAGGPQIHLAHILVALPENPTAEQIKTAQDKITGVKDLIDKGQMEFSAAAIRYSDSQNALEGGDLGWRSMDEVPPAFIDLIKTMKPGQVSQPLRGASGFQLLKLVETREAGKVIEQKVTEYHALDLMVKMGAGVSNDQAKAKIEEMRAQLVGGADFATLAKTSSDDTATKSKGGDMGWFQQGDWGDAVANQLKTLKEGELSAPFQSDVGWHVIRLLGVRTHDVSEQAAREAARQTIARRKSQDEYENFLRQMRSEAYVDIRLNDKT